MRRRRQLPGNAGTSTRRDVFYRYCRRPASGKDEAEDQRLEKSFWPVKKSAPTHHVVIPAATSGRVCDYGP